MALSGVTANATVTVGNAGDSDDSTYTVTVDTIAGDGTLGLDIAGGNNITDLATNAVNTTPTTDEIYTIDNVVPTVSITRDDANPTNANTVTFSVDFSEDVSNVDAADFTLALSGVTANATVTVGNAGDSDASTYTVTVDTIAGDGTLGLDIAGGNNIVDTLSNAVNTTPTTDEVYTIDNTVPTVAITRDDANPTNATTVVFSVDFSQDVTGVDAADFTLALSGVTANATVTVGNAGDSDASTYTVTVDTIAGDGTLGLDIAGGNNITDLATNAVNTTPTTDEIYTIDNVVPTVSITRDDANPTNANTVTFSVDFSEDVSNVDVADFTLALSGVTANATVVVGNAGDSDASTYTVTVDTIAGDGTLGLDIAGGNNIVDTLSNAVNTTPTTDEVYTIDNTVPTVAITRDDANPTNATTVVFSVDFSQDVTGVDAADFTLALSGVTANATVTVGNAGDSDASTYTVTVDTIAGDGTLGLDIAGGNNITDLATNALNTTPTTDEIYTIDNVVPTVSITRDDANPTNANTVVFSVDFSEDVSNVDAADFTLALSGVTANATVVVGNAGDSDASTYTVTVDTIAGDGTLGLDIAGGNNIVDTLSNAVNTTPTTDEVYTIDNTVPTVVITRDDANPTNATTVVFSVDFSQDVTGVDAADFTLALSGVTANATVTVGNAGDSDASTYTVIVDTIAGDGTLGLDIAGGNNITDLATNALNTTPTTDKVYTIDNVVPTASITRDDANPTNANTVVFSVDFSEDVSNVDAADFALALSGVTANATVTVGNAGDSDASTYTVTVDTIAGDGTLGLDIAGGNNIVDTLSNAVNTTPTTDEVYTIDNTVPTVVITRDDANPTNATTVVFSVDFSQDVTGVDAADFTLALSGVTANATVTVGNAGDSDASTYTVTVDTIAGDGTLGLDIAGGNNITDLATNVLNTTPTTDEIYTIDNVVPTASITRDDANPTNANTVVFSVDFSENVSNVDAADFALALSGVTANATVVVGNAGDADDSTYTVTVDTIAGDGTLGLDIAGGNNIVDTLSNAVNTTPTTDEVYTIDNTVPTVAITRDDTNPTNADSVVFSVDFSEDVTNVTAADFTLALSGVTANATVVVGNAGDADDSTYTVTVDTIAGDGTLGLNIAGGNDITDLSTNAVNTTPTTDEVYNIDNTVPTVSITRDDANPTNADTVTFSVDFSEDVANVTAAGFTLALSGVTANATVVVGNAGDADDSTYTVTVDTIAGDGTLGLDISGGNDITDLASNAVNTTPTTDDVYNIDNTVPTVSITRDNANPTNADTVTFSVDFSEDVTNVTAADFALALSGVTASATVTVGNAGDASDSTYTVTVDTIAGDGTLGLDIAGGNDIADLVSNAVNTTPTTDDVYNIDNTVPTVSITLDDTNPTNADTVTFSVDFSEDVQNVMATDFALALSGVTANATVTVGNAGDADDSTYTVTVDTIVGDGTLGLDIAGGNDITDLVTNVLNTTPTTDDVYNIDNTAPTVSITRDDANPTNADTLTFSADFSEDVQNVTAADFALALSGVTANATVTVGNAGDADDSTYTVTVDTIAGDGTLGLDIAGGNDIADLSTNVLNTTPTTDDVYNIDNTVPTVSITLDDANPTNADTVTFSVDFSEDVQNVTAADFALALSGVTANATVTVGNAGDADDSTYTVTVDTIAGDGTLGLDIAGGNDITDLVTNAINTTPTTDDIHNIDNTVPTVSITRDDANSTHATSVVFSVDFSEDVTGVDAADFTLALSGVTANSTVTVDNAGDADASTYTVTVDTISGDGTLGLDIAGGNNIADVATNALNTTPTTDEFYTIVNNAPNITSSNSPNVPENTMTVITVTINDIDGDTPTFSITGGADQGKFSINATSGDLTFDAAPNYESPTDVDTNNVYLVEVTTADGFGKTDVQLISVTVADVDEFDVGAISDNDAASNQVAENAANGTAVGVTALAGDADGTTNTITYSLDDSASARFAIDSSTGVITVADGSQLNYEAATSHDITIRATSADASISTQSLTINLSDIDEFDIGAISDGNTSADQVAENAANGTAVGVTALASDADGTTNTITYSLDDNAGGRFAIDATTGVVTVVDGSLLDYDAAASHDITIRATSADTSFNTESLTINLTEVNKVYGPPPVSDPPPASDPPPESDLPSDSGSDDAETQSEEATGPSIAVPAETPTTYVPLAPAPRTESRQSEQQVAMQIMVLPTVLQVESNSDAKLAFSATIGGFSAQHFEQALQVVAEVAPQLIAYVDPQLFWEKLDDFQEELQDDYALQFSAGTVAVASLAATVGYLFWMIKGGYLLAGIISQLPAWQFMDPLPIYDAVAGGYWEDEEEQDLGL